MNQETVRLFKEWFSDYCRSFYSQNAEDQRNIILKEEHTHNVCGNIVRIAEEESLNPGEILLAETIALFHDIGRFEQYAEYKTFRDSISVNHATLGVKILSDTGILKILTDGEREVILQAIRFHNAFSLPDVHDSDSHLLLRLIRDADKLDIWRVFLEYYESPSGERASAVGLGLPDTPEYSQEILACVFEKRMARLSNLRTITDFKLLQLSWIFDLTFRTSLRVFQERGYLGAFMKTLPKTDEIAEIHPFLDKYIRQRLKAGQSA